MHSEADFIHRQPLSKHTPYFSLPNDFYIWCSSISADKWTIPGSFCSFCRSIYKFLLGHVGVILKFKTCRRKERDCTYEETKIRSRNYDYSCPCSCLRWRLLCSDVNGSYVCRIRLLLWPRIFRSHMLRRVDSHPLEIIHEMQVRLQDVYSEINLDCKSKQLACVYCINTILYLLISLVYYLKGK